MAEHVPSRPDAGGRFVRLKDCDLYAVEDGPPDAPAVLLIHGTGACAAWCTVLVPAAMHVFGNANWWLSRWLDRRLPHLAIEPAEAGSSPVPAASTQPGGLRSAAR